MEHLRRIIVGTRQRRWSACSLLGSRGPADRGRRPGHAHAGRCDRPPAPRLRQHPRRGAARTAARGGRDPRPSCCSPPRRRADRSELRQELGSPGRRDLSSTGSSPPRDRRAAQRGRRRCDQHPAPRRRHLRPRATADPSSTCAPARREGPGRRTGRGDRSRRGPGRPGRGFRRGRLPPAGRDRLGGRDPAGDHLPQPDPVGVPLLVVGIADQTAAVLATQRARRARHPVGRVDDRHPVGAGLRGGD